MGRPSRLRAAAVSTLWPKRARTLRLRPRAEMLENRLMLDGELAGLVVGRVQSSYTAGSVVGNSIAITYTVYNTGMEAVEDVWLGTTLEPGIDLRNATVPADQNGREVGWSLGRIGPQGRSSVTVTLGLPQTVPAQLDSGARAFGIADAWPVSDATAPARLRAGTVAPELLSSTIDADTSDPFVQRQAAALDYDPQRIFAYLRDEVGYEAYKGSLRGARGTLWSGAGNALDEASLGVALMRASGIPARYAQGTLAFNQGQQLVASMFPAREETIGFLPPGTFPSNPTNEFSLVDAAREHAWFQFDTGDGNGLRDADSAFATAQVGQTFTTATTTFAEVPDARRHKTTITLEAETYSQIGALFGGSPLGTQTVLQRTFNDVELVGKPLTIGHFVSRSVLPSPIFTSITTVYTPYLAVGDEAYGPGDGELIRGQAFQEVLTNFPLATQVVTGLFLRLELKNPNGAVETVERPLLDRIGQAARQGLVAPSLSTDPNSPPAISEYDLTTLNVLPGLQDRGTVVAIRERVEELRQVLLAARTSGAADSDPAVSLAVRNYLTGVTWLLAARYLEVSDSLTARAGEAGLVKAYQDSPRVVLSTSRVVYGPDGRSGELRFGLDLRREAVRAIAYPGQSLDAVDGFNLLRGFMLTGAEDAVLAETLPGQGSSAFSAHSIFQAALAQGAAPVLVTSDNLNVLTTLPISLEAKARITMAVEQGKLVLVPNRPALVNNQARVSWYEMDRNTLETIGVTEDGGHQAIVEYAFALAIPFTFGLAVGFGLDALLAAAAGDDPGIFKGFGFGATVTGFLGLFGAIPAGIALAGAAWIPFTAFLFAPFFFGIALAVLIGGIMMVNDPPVGQILADPELPAVPPANVGAATVDVAPNQVAGPVSGSVGAKSVRVSNEVSATWSSGSRSGFLGTSFSAAQATVRDPDGRLIGTGAVGLATSVPLPMSVSGNVQYRVDGIGSLGFYGEAATGLAAAGDWESYTAQLQGDATLAITTGELLLNGVALPAGSYTITTNAITISGRGATASPNLDGAATITSSNAQVQLGPGTGNLSIGGTALDPVDGVSLAGYQGTVTVEAGSGGTDLVTLAGGAMGLLAVSGLPRAVSADQNTPAQIGLGLKTNLGGGFDIEVEAPAGWEASVDPTGTIRVKPAAGLQSGVFPVRVIARSRAIPGVVAQGEVLVTVTPTQPGVTIDVVPDPMFTVPYSGAELPTAFRAVIHNSGPAAETYNLTFPQVPAGFTVLNSGTQVTVPAGETVIVGVYLRPNAGAIPAPGTVLNFQVRATSTTAPAITATTTESFTVPEIHALAISLDPPSVSTTPGATRTATLELRATGNVGETVTFDLEVPSGLTATGLTPVTLAAGETRTLTLTFTTGGSVPLNRTLDAQIGVKFGTGSTARTVTVPVAVRVVVPGADALAAAATAANELGNSGLTGRLNELAASLTTLFQAPTDVIARSQSLASLDSLITQVIPDPFLGGFVGGLTAARGSLATATTATEVQAAITALGTALDDFAERITAVARHGVEVTLGTERGVATAGTPVQFDVFLENTGSLVTTYDLAVIGLPAGVTGEFRRGGVVTTSVTLQPGEQLTGGPNGVVLRLAQVGPGVVPTTFTVTATAREAPEIVGRASGALAVRDPSFRVARVDATPPFTAPGGQVAVSALLQTVVNQATDVKASFEARASNGTVVFTSAPVTQSLTPATTATTVNLGFLDTTGLPEGVYTLIVSLQDAAGQPIAGATAQRIVLVGLPVTANITATPTVLPSGDQVVDHQLDVEVLRTFPDPLTLLGEEATNSNAVSAAIRGNIAYVSSTEGLEIVDVTDPSDPVYIKRIAADLVVKGGANLVRIDGDRLYLVSQLTLNATGFSLIIYDLTGDPLNPQLLSNTNIPYRFVSDMFIKGDSAIFTTTGIFFFPGNIFDQFGSVISVDISNPASPIVSSALFNNRGAPDGGNFQHGGAAILNDQIAYAASTSSVGGDTQTGVGQVRVIDISTPSQPSLLRSLDIPGTNRLVSLAPQGNRVLVAGSTGGLLDPFPANGTMLTGNLTLSVLDTTDPANPILLNTLVTEATFYPGDGQVHRLEVSDLGNGLFGISDLLLDGKAVVLLVNVSDPSNLVVSGLETPNRVNGLTVSGTTLYAGTVVGLSVYEIGELVSEPVTVSVRVPKGTGVEVAAGSFDKAPTRIETGASFDTIVWERQAAALNTRFSFKWQQNVNDLMAGETRATTLGTTVAFVDQGTPGTFELPGTSVVGQSIVRLSPTTGTAQPGGSTTYDVILSNPLDAPANYVLRVQNLDFDISSDLQFTVTVPASGTLVVPLRLSPSVTADLGDRPFTVQVEGNGNGTLGRADGSLTVAGAVIPAPDETARGVVVALDPIRATAGQGSPARFTVRVTNTGSETDNYLLELTGLPANVQAQLDQTFVEVPAGPAGSRVIGLSIQADGVPAGQYPFTVRATSFLGSTTTGSASGTLVVSSRGVDVVLTPGSGAPGTSFQLNVTNQGDTTDTFTLSLAGPGALVSTLGVTQVTLAPGASQMVPIQTSGLDFAPPGTLSLMGIATSTSDAGVSDLDQTSLAIAEARGLEVTIEPQSRVLSAPGATSYLVVVRNTGNVEEEYTITITETVGPLTARLQGADGQPTQTIARFRVPGLQTATIRLEVNQGVAGASTITVEVTSLTDPTRSQLAVASLTVTQSQAIATTTQLTAVPNPAAPGDVVRLTAQVTPQDSAVLLQPPPTGTITFQVDGVAQAPIAITAIGNGFGAVLDRSGLAPGRHIVVAIYSGDSRYGASVSGALEVTVGTPTTGDGPQVVDFRRLGVHAQPTRLVLRFDRPLDPARAGDLSAYQLVDPRGRPIPIRAATLDASGLVVTLQPAMRLNLNRRFRLTVAGQGANGLTDTSGRLLDGDGDRQAGGDYSATVDRSRLVLKTAPKATPVGLKNGKVAKAVPQPVALPGPLQRLKARARARANGVKPISS